MLTEDVLDRHVDDEGNLHTTKLLTKTNSMPKWGERLYKGPKFVAIVEESVVDPKAQTFTTYTRNISMSRFMVRMVVNYFIGSSPKLIDS